jgi:hypothetical protein
MRQRKANINSITFSVMKILLREILTFVVWNKFTSNGCNKIENIQRKFANWCYCLLSDILCVELIIVAYGASFFTF